MSRREAHGAKKSTRDPEPDPDHLKWARGVKKELEDRKKGAELSTARFEERSKKHKQEKDDDWRPEEGFKEERDRRKKCAEAANARFGGGSKKSKKEEDDHWSSNGTRAKVDNNSQAQTKKKPGASRKKWSESEEDEEVHETVREDVSSDSPPPTRFSPVQTRHRRGGGGRGGGGGRNWVLEERTAGFLKQYNEMRERVREQRFGASSVLTPMLMNGEVVNGISLRPPTDGEGIDFFDALACMNQSKIAKEEAAARGEKLQETKVVVSTPTSRNYQPNSNLLATFGGFDESGVFRDPVFYEQPKPEKLTYEQKLARLRESLANPKTIHVFKDEQSEKIMADLHAARLKREEEKAERERKREKEETKKKNKEEKEAASLAEPVFMKESEIKVEIEVKVQMEIEEKEEELETSHHETSHHETSHHSAEGGFEKMATDYCVKKRSMSHVTLRKTMSSSNWSSLSRRTALAPPRYSLTKTEEEASNKIDEETVSAVAAITEEDEEEASYNSADLRVTDPWDGFVP